MASRFRGEIRDLALAREVQEHLYPRMATVSCAVTLFGKNTPARMVSRDLYEFFSFSPGEVALLCADVSGKGVSAALMMAHLQAVAHGRRSCLVLVRRLESRRAGDPPQS
jgi:serine phosphatase RsbU (regulator of sigma subunit)